MSSLPFKISISNKDIENSYSVFVCSRPERNTIMWRQTVQPDDVQVAYLETEKIYSEQAIEVNSFIENYIEPVSDTIYVSNSSTIYSEKENLIFTTIVKNENSFFIPMFFGHRLTSVVPDTQPSFFLWNKATDSNLFIYDKDYSFIASNVKNELDIKNGVYRASFVSYLSGTVESYAAVNEPFKEEPLFREETIYDYLSEEASYGVKKPFYRKNKEGNLWRFDFPYIAGQTIYYKEDSKTKVKPFISEGLEIRKPWPLLLDGREFVVLDGYGRTWDFSLYKIDTYSDQMYFPYSPFLTQKKEGKYVSEFCFSVPDKHILVEPSKNLQFSFTVWRNGVPILGQTTREELLGKRLSGSYLGKDIVLYDSFTGGLDYSLGVVTYTNGIPLQKNDTIFAEYIVDDEGNSREFYNVNPTNERWMLEGDMYFFLTPTTLKGNTKIHWLKTKKVYDANLDTFKDIIFYSSTFQNTLVGLSLGEFASTHCVLDPFKGVINTENSNYFILLCSASFKKEKYINQIMHKDLRVYAGIKNDLDLVKKGKDFLFSRQLNPENEIEIHSKQHLAVYVDRTELPLFDVNLNPRKKEKGYIEYFTLTPISTYAETVGSGILINVNVSAARVQGPYSKDYISFINRGIGYVTGEEVVILGSKLGGKDGVNDLTITIGLVSISGSIETIASVSGTYAVQKLEDYAETFSTLESEILKNKYIGTFPHIMYPDCPKIRKFMVLNGKLTLEVDVKSLNFNILNLYSSKYGNLFPNPSIENEVLLATFDIDDAVITNHIAKFEIPEFVYVPETTGSNFVYCRWASSGIKIESANSPIINFYNSQN